MIVPALTRLTFTSLVRSRRFVIAGLVGMIPLLLGVALLVADHSDHVDAGVGAFDSNVAGPLAFVVLGGTIPFIAMLLAGSIVADDVEDRTFSYLLVRPLRRHQLYMSRLLPAAAVAAGLAMAQVLLFALLRLLAWSLYGRGTFEVVRGASLETWQVIVTQGGMGLLAAALAACAFLALFSFVAVLTTRYHFLANVLAFATFELPFGNIGGQGAGVLTITYHARSLLEATTDPTFGYHAAHWWVAVLALVAIMVLWTAIAADRMGRRDFNVTSAAG